MPLKIKSKVLKYKQEGQVKTIEAIKGEPGDGGGDIVQDPENEQVGMVVPGTIVGVDKTLTMKDYAAEAKAVGDKIADHEERIETLEQGGSGVTDVQVNGASVVTDGVANIPNATNTTLGVVKCHGTRGVTMLTGVNAGILSLYQASQNSFDNRSSYHAVTSSNIDLAVRTAMCDGRGIAWTAEQQKAAQERMGFVTLTQEEYDLLETKGESTIYLIVEGDDE